MWLVSEYGYVYNADRILYFGIEKQMSKTQFDPDSIVKVEWSFYIYGSVHDEEGDMDYLLASGFHSESGAKAELNRFLRSAAEGEKVFRFRRGKD